MLGPMRHFENLHPRYAHVMKHDHRPRDLAVPAVDRSGGVFDGVLRIRPVESEYSSLPAPRFCFAEWPVQGIG